MVRGGLYSLQVQIVEPITEFADTLLDLFGGESFTDGLR
jgi:hypothetical protein